MSYNVYLSLGSNIDPGTHIPQTVRRLDKEFTVRAISSVYRTSPVAVVDGGDDFHNLSTVIRTDLMPSKLKNRLRNIERDLGRDRTGDDNLYESRVMDVDILLYEPEPVNFTPHDQIYDETFVVYPLSEIYDPANREDLPDTREDWREKCDEDVMLGKVFYEWPGDLEERVR